MLSSVQWSTRKSPNCVNLSSSLAKKYSKPRIKGLWLYWLQRDQIGRNFASFAKNCKLLAIFWQFIPYYYAKCWAYFGKFGTLLG